MEEKIKQGESASVATGRRKNHKIRDLIIEMWPAYMIEIFVIILGISITLALEEWREKGKENELAAIYEKNLAADIEVDLEALNHTEQSTAVLLNKGNELLDFIKDPAAHDLTPDRADSDLSSIIGREKFISSDATFSDLTHSGNLRLLKDIQLKKLLFAYYDLAQSIKEVQDAEQQATIVISGPYFLKRFPLWGVGSRQSAMDAKQLVALGRDVEFGNNVLLRVGTRRELLEDYQKADSLGKELKTALAATANL
jgi:hypothetical protein